MYAHFAGTRQPCRLDAELEQSLDKMTMNPNTALEPTIRTLHFDIDIRFNRHGFISESGSDACGSALDR